MLDSGAEDSRSDGGGICKPDSAESGLEPTTLFPDSATDYRMANASAEAMDYNVSPGYFQAAATTLLRGQSIHLERQQRRAARGRGESGVCAQDLRLGGKGHWQFFQDLGRKAGAGGRRGGGREVQDAERRPQPAMFSPDLASRRQGSISGCWCARTAVRRNWGRALATTLHELDPGLPFTIDSVGEGTGRCAICSACSLDGAWSVGGLGAMLAITGIFGMAAYSVSKRLRELGIRIALGAQRKEVLLAALGRDLPAC